MGMLCIRCMNPAVEGHRLCKHCLEAAEEHSKAYSAKYNRKWRKNNREKYLAAQRADYAKRRDKILAMRKAAYAAYQAEGASTHKLCAKCGKNPRLYNRTVCRECYNKNSRNRYKAAKSGDISTELCAICGENPRMYRRTVCAECCNAQVRQRRKKARANMNNKAIKDNHTLSANIKKYAAYTAVCEKILSEAVANYKRKEAQEAQKNLCKVCGKAPKLAYNCRCRGCYNAYRRKYEALKRAKCGKEGKLNKFIPVVIHKSDSVPQPVQVHVMDPVQVQVQNNSTSFGNYVAVVLFVLWAITMIGLIFR